MSRIGLAWVMLVSPASAWRALSQRLDYPFAALNMQLLLVLLGTWLAVKPLGELAQVSGIGKGAGFLVSFLSTAGGYLFILLVVAVLLRFIARALGAPIDLPRLLTWLVYSITPLFLGRFLGLLSFAVFQPLAKDPRDALALQMNPLGLSFAPLFESLSLPWVYAAAFDVFTLWSVVLLWSGARRYLELSLPRAAALLGTLLLIWLLALAAIWQGLQRSI